LRHGAGSIAVILCLLLAACGTTQPKPDGPGMADPQRRQYLSAIDEWTFAGRVALSDGKNGGSGNLQWYQHSTSLEIKFRAAFGRGAWILEAVPGQAVLQTGKGETFHSTDVSNLVSRYLGWHVPMDAMAHWVMGLAAPGSDATLVTDQFGLPRKISQLGWEISYDRWDKDHQPAMPVRINASRGEYSFKLIVRNWRLVESP